MRRTSTSWNLSLFALLACAGCVPFTVYDIQGFKGQIVDSATNAPISNAHVEVQKMVANAIGAGAVSSVAASTTTGNFEVPQVTHRIWAPPLPYDPLSPDARITISAVGYQTQQFSYYEVVKSSLRDRKVPEYLVFDMKRQQ